MKNPLFGEGGFPFYIDDLETLQQELQYAVYGQFFDGPACVLSGCEVSTQGSKFNVSSGLVFLENQVARFAGAAGVTLPLELYLGAAVLTEERPYEIGGSKPCLSERPVLTRAVSNAPTAAAVRVTAQGVLRATKVREAETRSIWEMQMLMGYNAEEYDSTGKGRYGTKAFGWALMNGQNGTAKTQGRFPVFFDATDPQFETTMKTGGAKTVTLTTEQLPVFTPEMEQAGEHAHDVPSRAGDGNNAVARRGDNNVNDGTVKTGKSGNHTHQMKSIGGGKSHENLPPFYSVAGRQWIGLQF